MGRIITLSIILRLFVPIFILIVLITRSTPPFDTSHSIISPDTHLSGLRWDAIHYTSIALHGYQYEQQGAWMPLWPWIMRYLGLALHRLSGKPGDVDVTDVVHGGEVVNLFTNLGAICILYQLTRTLYPQKQFAEITTLFYIFSPTPAPNASPYTEPSYAFFTLLGFYLACKKNWWTSALSLGTATGIRGTGVFGAGVLGWLLIFDGDKRASSRFTTSVKRLTLAIPLFLIVIAPFLAFQLYAYLSFCIDPTTKRSWCEKVVPISYTFIQAEYWNVGFLRYWTPDQIPNLIIAIPILLPSLYGTYTYLQSFRYSLSSDTYKSPRTRGDMPLRADPRLLPLHLHSLHQTLLLIFSAHAQIALRVAITNPVIYWNLASMSFDWETPAPRRMKTWGKAWVAWSVVWGAIGIVLWAGHYPPA